MADPTANYLWDIPNENSDPWFTPFDTLISAIDTTVNSVERIAAGPRHAVVISAYLTGSVTIAGTTDATNVLAYRILSAAPYNIFVGCFSTIYSGSHVRFDLQTTNFHGQLAATAATASFSGSLLTNFRLVVTNAVGSFTFGTESAWKYTHTMVMQRAHQGFTTVGSLGQGNWRAEVQWRGTLVSAVASTWSMNANDWLVLTVTEGRKGNT